MSHPHDGPFTSSRPRLIGDPGSTHHGRLDRARELVTLAADLGLDACKFQLLTPKEAKGGNIAMDWEWMPELIELGKEKGVEVFASAFDKSGVDYLAHLKCKSIKFAYSQYDASLRYPLKAFDTVYTSCDVMSETHYKDARFAKWKTLRLYCIPIYPVPYIVDFEGLFPRFDGFSSHCLGVNQEIAAVSAGARYLEFHFQGTWPSDTPDGKFAKPPALVEKLVRRVK
jgi:N,N'-diacetyllegionaminate synthase